MLLSLVSLSLITTAVPCFAGTVPNITYKSGNKREKFAVFHNALQCRCEYKAQVSL